MKKTFLAKRNALLSSTNISWGAYALIVAILTLLLRLIAPNFFWTLFTPVFRASDSLSQASHAFFNSFGDTAKLALQNEKLTNENSALALQNQALLQKANSLSGLARESRGITAGVVARPPASPYDTLVLAGGSADGVTLGMEAFGDGGVPLGVITAVLADFSRVTLFSSSGMTLSGWVGRTNLPVTITGAGAGAMRASVARSAGITSGDIVFAPGPGQLPIGSVARVDSDPSSPSVTLRIMPALNLFSVAWVTLRDTGSALRGALSSTTPTLP
ncbi:rod shape-determining protein MreC [bacterium]|nr:MAG: rod shape-determining protein MreC [bacterium]